MKPATLLLGGSVNLRKDAGLAAKAAACLALNEAVFALRLAVCAAICAFVRGTESTGSLAVFFLELLLKVDARLEILERNVPNPVRTPLPALPKALPTVPNPLRSLASLPTAPTFLVALPLGPLPRELFFSVIRVSSGVLP